MSSSRPPLDEAVEAALRLDENGLRHMNRIIVERLKLVSQAHSTKMLARFSAGFRVAFTAPSGEMKTGVIQKLNKKSATVVTDDGHRWNVHPSFLSPIVEGDAAGTRESLEVARREKDR